MTESQQRARAKEPEFRDQAEAERWRAVRRAVLDHVLGLVTETPGNEILVLRGSMAMAAWVGDEARDPADLDFVVLTELLTRGDPFAEWDDEEEPAGPWHEYPYVDRMDIVQQWPEFADGAGRYEMWKDGDEQFETDGQRPVLPPEGTHWGVEPDWDADRAPVTAGSPFTDLLHLLAERDEAMPGVRLDAGSARWDTSWLESYYDAKGARLLVPWTADGLPSGEAQVDFAWDEPILDSPVWTLVPRRDGGSPSVVQTASPELSLAWKLLWLDSDCAGAGTARGKDLYDAVLLAESGRVRLSRDLFRKVLSPTGVARFDPAWVLSWTVDWATFRAAHPRVYGTAEEWLLRLARALAPMLTG